MGFLAFVVSLLTHRFKCDPSAIVTVANLVLCDQPPYDLKFRIFFFLNKL